MLKPKQAPQAAPMVSPSTRSKLIKNPAAKPKRNPRSTRKTRACWDKGVNVIAYPAHGRKMAKVIKIFNHKKEV